jgi:prepilin-type N-terminal cleavage/methylation domain-containing protein
VDELMDSTQQQTAAHRGSRGSCADGILRRSLLVLRHRRRASGFTLLEAMIAMSILTIGTLGVAGALVTSMNMSRESRSRAHSIYLAEEQMEIFQLMTSDEIDAELADPAYPNDPAGAIDPDPDDEDPTTFNRSWEILPNDPEFGVYQLTVIVSFTDKLGQIRSERLRSLKAGF